MNKKLYALLFLSFMLVRVNITMAQTPVLCENFNAYDSTTANANYNGWSLTYYSQFSYYTSTFSSGFSGPNSYKFGIDSATAITPIFNGATHVSWWMRGNSTDAASTFYIYESNNGTTWNLIQAMNPISATPGYVQFALTAGSNQIKFFYDKSVGNVAFDDFCATNGPINTSVNETNLNNSIFVYPSPSNGLINVRFNDPVNKINEIEVINMLGLAVKDLDIVKHTANEYIVDLRGNQPGFYFLRLQTERGVLTKRITLN